MVTQHRHEEHICYCPNCGKEIMVEEGVKCREQTCTVCGARMRARETGEYRES
jgi:uncharacterized protein (DUF983 family)